jgi:hypothetical protein
MRDEEVRVGPQGRFVSLRLAGGRRPKGRGGAWRRSQPISESRIMNEVAFATFRPTRRRALSGGGTPPGKPAAFSGRAVGANRIDGVFQGGDIPGGM